MARNIKQEPTKKEKKRVELHGYLEEFREALEQEIEAIEHGGQSSTILRSGTPLLGNGPDFRYRFTVEYAPSIPADTPCKLVVGKNEYDVTVISFEENAIIISSSKNLPSDMLGNARLENGATVLMERQIRYIEQNADKENQVGLRMLPKDGQDYAAKTIHNYKEQEFPADLKMNTQQRKAIKSAVEKDISYIWGPPGTGKTSVIGQIINVLYQHNRSVLIVSHTNTAVDGAIEKADDIIVGKGEGPSPVLRIGIPAKTLKARVTLAGHILALGKEIDRQIRDLEKQQTEIQRHINEMRPTFAKAAWIEENNLSKIQLEIHHLNELQAQLEVVKLEYEELKSAEAKIRAENPEYADFELARELLGSTQADLESARQLFQQAQARAEDASEQMQVCRDEVRKFDVYENLKAQEAKLMSPQFIRREQIKVQEQIIALEQTLSALAKEKKTASKTIADYESSGLIGKLLTGKQVVLEAKSRLSSADKQSAEVKTELEQKQALSESYDKQLKDVYLLQNQMEAVVPSHTKDFWSNRCGSLQKSYVTAKRDMDELFVEQRELGLRVDQLQKRLQESEVAFKSVDEIANKVSKKGGQYSHIRDSVNSCKSQCIGMLEKEFQYCAAFSEIEMTSSPQEEITRLSILYEEIQAEVNQIDIPSLSREKEHLQKELATVLHQLNELKQQQQELEKKAIQDAKVVGATLTKTYLSEPLQSRKFDTVILDEASMASIPALWCACYLAEKNVVIVGDFLQLSPIVLSSKEMAQKWLGRDIFYHSHMQQRAKKSGKTPDNFIMLDEQFRMEPQIADIANMYYREYRELVCPQKYWREKEREDFYKWYPGNKASDPIHLIDTESLHAWVTGIQQGKGHSRLNYFSASGDVDLAFKLLEGKLPAGSGDFVESPSILIIAPYKPHVARINQLIELEYKNRGFTEGSKGKDLGYVKAGTIHSFQGSQADIVIFDLVVDEPHWRTNLFMTGEEVNKGLRQMFNVAVSRAKFQLFVVGNFAFCQKRAKGNALSDLLNKLLIEDQLPKIDAKELLPNLLISAKPSAVEGAVLPCHLFCRGEFFDNYFLRDLQHFERQMIIYSPFMTENRISILLPSFENAISSGKQIIVITKAMSDRGKKDAFQYKKCEDILEQHGIIVIHKEGMHEKNIIIDDTVSWNGSLNALSYSGQTGEIMERYDDKSATANLVKALDVGSICQAVERQIELKCPICGGEMTVHEGKDGGIYWQCVNKDFSRNTSQAYPVDGIIRCKECNVPYEFQMKSEPRWVCPNNPRHYQKMRFSDLKLEKMAAKIPAKRIAEINRFFEAKRKEQQNQPDAEKLESRKGVGAASIPASQEDCEQLGFL